MLRYIVHINDPQREKEVEELLKGIKGDKGFEVERQPKKLARKPTNKRQKAGAKTKPPTAAEKRFMKDLTEAFKSVEDHFSGKKKLMTLKEVLNGL